MRIVVTGATGFIGKHVVRRLIQCGHSVVAVSRDIKSASGIDWFNNIEFIQCDLHEDFKPIISLINPSDVIVHFAWSGLPNYQDYFHISQNMQKDLKFLENVLRSGIKQILVAGTCLEYGMQCGPLSEDMETKPTTPYGFAKDVLRKSLQFMQDNVHFTLQWLRIFYVFGEGQNKNSMLSQLDRAIQRGDKVFNMSKGDQLRDYMPVEDVATAIEVLLRYPQLNGVINCCSGKPISIYDLALRYCSEKNSSIILNRGYYPYPDYEPMAFWGIRAKLDQLSFLQNSTAKGC